MGPYIEGPRAWLLERGYTPGSTKYVLALAGRLGRWMQTADVKFSHLDSAASGQGAGALPGSDGSACGQGDAAAVAEMEAKLREIEEAIDGVEAREANIRAGYVYVIFNIGAFGPQMVKIGMTRRLEPDTRIRELGHASVPFRFDTHALVFSEGRGWTGS
jgi:hypothetical protein